MADDMTSALLGNMLGRENNPNGGVWNNPWIYLVFLALFGRNGFGFGGGGGDTTTVTALQDQLTQLQSAIADNKNASDILTQIGRNGTSLADIATALAGLGGAVGINAERVINSGLLGVKDLQASMADCCCGIKSQVQQMGYDSQLATCQQTNAINTKIDSLGTLASQNTQRILDALCNNKMQDMQTKLFDLSQQAQTASIVSQLKTTTTTAS